MDTKKVLDAREAPLKGIDALVEASNQHSEGDATMDVSMEMAIGEVMLLVVVEVLQDW